MAGLYIHIPFCKTRCIYCGFYSTTYNSLQEEYVGAVLHELQLRLDYLHEPVATVYLGGGTPSQLHPELLERLLRAVVTSSDGYGEQPSEVTIECNPDDITPELASLLVKAGVNRVSMGVQTFSDERLRFIRRRHTAGQVGKAVETLREHGIKNISIDLMFGFPSESLADWQYDLSEAIKLDVEHISAYSLMYEEGTPLYNMLERGEIEETDEETYRSMYYTLIDTLTEAGYVQYEISNFARPGYQSRHNSSYWHAVPYLGLGAGAHSYNGSSRSWNVSDIRIYINKVNSGILPAEHEILDEATRYNDLVATALRTREGIAVGNGKYHGYMLRMAEPMIKKGLLAITDGRLHLTREGLYVSDDVMSELIYVE